MAIDAMDDPKGRQADSSSSVSFCENFQEASSDSKFPNRGVPLEFRLAVKILSIQGEVGSEVRCVSSSVCLQEIREWRSDVVKLTIELKKKITVSVKRHLKELQGRQTLF